MVFINKITQKDILEIFADVINDRSKYFDLHPYLNDVPGFSIQKPYEQNLKFKPPLDRKGNPDEVCLFKVGLYHLDPDEQSGRYQIYVAASKFSKFISKYPFYNFEQEDCPTKESLAESNKTPSPIPRHFVVEIDLKVKKLYLNNKEILPTNLFAELYDFHIKNVTSLFIARKKIQRSLCYIIVSPFNLINAVLYFASKLLFGITISASYKSNIEPGELQLTSYANRTKTVPILNYEMSVQTIYSFTVICSGVYAYNYYCLGISDFVESVLNNAALTLIFGLPLVMTYDYLIPYLFEQLFKLNFRIVNLLQSLLLR
ncbi:hypothetical protein CH362_18650 [Leptospira saintgironsiae]|uniref:Uncharacterized protein n=2 Tax=Leptospira saintgironsiae TaxID=2023183 RepID=A0A2M9Y7N1_9LEPT|nr:hypothetical protein CH362_18650 [Leptospira saintgironsiae]